MKNIAFIGAKDVLFQLRQGSTVVWVFVMPPIFFYFIGTVTGGFSSGFVGQSTPITVVAENPGFLRDQVDLRLSENDFEANWIESLELLEGEAARTSTLTIDANMTDVVLADEQVAMAFDTSANALTREFEEIRIQRALYTTLADIVAADMNSEVALSAELLVILNEKPRAWQLDVSPAGERLEIPSGFEQAVPGILVMFTLLVLLTTSGSMLVQERTQGLLRRLASAPISRTEVITGKWAGRMVLAAIQIAVALLFGTYLFDMNWGPDLAMIIVVLAAWGGFCASAGLWLGTVAKTEAQAGGLGVLAANALAALGGCWWPIEVTPDWMQAVQKFLPTGWTMDALHQLISFQSGAASVILNVAILIVATIAVGALAIRKFEYM